jgi:hypothetical protein
LQEEKKEIWFPVKKYGYGWGFPITWQGWAVLLSYLLFVTVGSFVLTDSPKNIIYFIAYVTFLTAILLYVCWKKGEKPEWRWGDKK